MYSSFSWNASCLDTPSPWKNIQLYCSGNVKKLCGLVPYPPQNRGIAGSAERLNIKPVRHTEQLGLRNKTALQQTAIGAQTDVCDFNADDGSIEMMYLHRPD